MLREFATIRQSGRKPFGTANDGLADGSGKGSKHAAKNPLMKRIKGIPVEYASKPPGQKAGTLFEFASAVSLGRYSKFKQCLSRQLSFQPIKPSVVQAPLPKHAKNQWHLRPAARMDAVSPGANRIRQSVCPNPREVSTELYRNTTRFLRRCFELAPRSLGASLLSGFGSRIPKRSRRCTAHHRNRPIPEEAGIRHRSNRFPPAGF